MAIDKTIFDKYQKSLLNAKYVDLTDENIVYLDETTEVKPLTVAEYYDLGSTVASTWKDTTASINPNTLLSSTGLTEKLFTASALTFTSLNNGVIGVRNSSRDNNASLFTNESSLTFLEEIVSNTLGNVSSTEATMGTIFDTLSNVFGMIPSITSILFNIVGAVVEVAGVVTGAVTGIVGAIGGVGKSVWNGLLQKEDNNLAETVSNSASDGFAIGNELVNLINPLMGIAQSAIVNYSNWASNTLSLISDTFTNTYQDGVTETKFGQKMEDSWKLFRENNSTIVSFTENTPLTNLGTEPILFGAPPRYNTLSDPRDRSYMNTFIKDGNIMSIIPGKPKYNGLSLGKIDTSKDVGGIRTDLNTASTAMSSFFTSIGAGRSASIIAEGSVDNDKTISGNTQTTSEDYAAIALEYLKRNGISDIFNANDKRYYTFEKDYDGYYSYLETMLNTIYTKMGLGETGDGSNRKSELFTFFKHEVGKESTLIEKYSGKSLGFYFDGNPSVSESMSNETNDPAGMKSSADSMSDEFQRINYVTGFGTKASRKAGIASARLVKMTNAVGDAFSGFGSSTPFSKMSSALGGVAGSGLSKLANFSDKMLGALSYTSSTDLNTITESMLSTNGMKTQFPNLWSESNYSKSISVDFEFVSPYGDPLSIFQYCYVPLCSLLALALPKQAEENGYVNPFFLRMDIPGVISSDFAIISNITWVRGGHNNLWTVDKHPRAISVSVVFEDLYQFLAMTKRISYLSANPNYSMFLDSFSGIRSLYTSGNSINNDYWNLLVNRLNSNSLQNESMWNQTSVDRTIHDYLSKDDPQQFFNNYYKRDISWMKARD